MPCRGSPPVPPLAEPRRNAFCIRHRWAPFSRKQPQQILICFKAKPLVFLRNAYSPIRALQERLHVCDMEKGSVTPDLARVTWDAHSFNGSNERGMSLACT
eukprot:4374979-Pyramimonas_sp.AAC.1